MTPEQARDAYDEARRKFGDILINPDSTERDYDRAKEVLMRGNLITGNTACSGGGIHSGDGSPRIEGNTISNNGTTASCGGNGVRCVLRFSAAMVNVATPGTRSPPKGAPRSTAPSPTAETVVRFAPGPV